MTGTEAISNGIPALKPPGVLEWHHPAGLAQRLADCRVRRLHRRLAPALRAKRLRRVYLLAVGHGPALVGRTRASLAAEIGHQRARRNGIVALIADLHPLHHQVVVPIARLNLPTVRAVQYAASISPNVNAVYVANDPVAAAELEANWERWSFGIPLTVIESPYRSLTGPLMHFLAELKRNEGADLVTVAFPSTSPIAGGSTSSMGSPRSFSSSHCCSHPASW
jgi:hypothetical protein